MAVGMCLVGGPVACAVTAWISQLFSFWMKVPSANPLTTSYDSDVPSNPQLIPALTMIRDSLSTVTIALGVLGIFMVIIRSVMRNSAHDLLGIVKLLANVIGVSVFGVTVVWVGIQASDAYEPWILERVQNQIGSTDMAGVLFPAAALSAAGFMTTGIVALVVILGSLAQTVAMLFRGALLMVFLAVWPSVAASTATESGRNAFKKMNAWIVALILFKPVAATIYALGLLLVADNQAATGVDSLMNVIYGCMILLLLLAAATGAEPITTVYRWASNPDDETPALILRMAGHSGPATTLFAIIALSERQRDGVVGTAAKMLTWLTNPDLLPWITPGTGGRPEFRPDAFVRSTQTLYLVSMEGRGSARAIAAALTVAVVRAGETHASHSPGGRLPVPMMVVLDEAANVVRWPDLPDLYSHFGSRGIVISTFLQSWNQGVVAWGRDGMEELWSAANLRVIGAGVAQADFLTNISRLIGDHDIIRHDVSSSGKGGGLFDSGRSTSTRLQREPIFEPAELASLPRGRAVMLSSGAPAALVELRHWSACDYADDVRASETYYTGLAAPQEAR